MQWKTLKSAAILKTDFFTIHQDQCLKPDGGIVAAYYTIDQPNAAVIAAFTKEKEIILIKQYRHPVKSISTEIPAGHINPDETNLIQAAERELLEETGYKPSKILALNQSWASAGIMSNQVDFFIGLNCEKIQDQNLDPHENIDTFLTPWTTAADIIEKHNIKDLGSITSLFLAEQYFKDHDLS